MRGVLSLLLVLVLAACGKAGGSYANDKAAEPPEPVPKDGPVQKVDGAEIWSDWREGGSDGPPGPDHFRVMVHYASLETLPSPTDPQGKPFADKLTYAWVMRLFDGDQKPVFKDEGEYRREYTRFAVDCKTKRLAGIAVERQDKERHTSSRRDLAGYQWEMRQAEAGTTEEVFVTQLCKLAAEKGKSQ